MASTSSATPSQSIRKLTYDVFLSFRGEDTRKNFVDHLYDRLKQKGIHTFKDDERLENGQCIAPTLLQAIQESRFAIVVFSKQYASSTWCLDEVAKIIECKEKLNQVVVPIFYNVEPSHVRKQTGSFEESFAKHKENFKDDEGKANVERWRKALTKAGNIVGHDLHGDKYNGFELACIKGVVDDIFKQLHLAPSIPKDSVGLESRLNDINTLMEVSYKDVKLIGIWGMGGIGKTTLARAAFAKFSGQFDGACFLADIRENHSKHGLVALQKRLLSKLLKESSMDIDDVDEGIQMIEERLKWKRVLIIIDDVDQQDQLDKLVGDGEWLCNGSRLIITTRDKHLFSKFGVVVECYEVKKLDEKKALQLFSWHAFKKESPENEFEDLSTSFVRHASGLPLALKVWGSFLCGRTDIEVWESTLEKIKDIPDDKLKVLSQLRISYDGLDENCKKVFLDIACFFRGERRDYAEKVLKSCKLRPAANISVLIDRCLLFETDRGYINMHDLIHEMGLNIAREIPWSRRWRLDHLDDEPKAVEGLFLSFTDGSGSYDENISPSIEAFKQMTKLKMLIVQNDTYYYRWWSESLESSWMSIMYYLPRSLMVLKFPYYPWSKLFCTKGLKNLTYLDLNNSISLLETPNFVEMPNLERLDLSCCKKLKEIHPSVGNLKKLVLLDLCDCSNLEKLPNFNQVSSLRSLELWGCYKLENFPTIKASMPYLVALALEGVRIIELPSSIQQLHGLTKLRLHSCHHLVRLSDGLCELKNLKVLRITWCSKIESLPKNLKHLILLEYLNLVGSGFVYLPKSFSQLPRLQYLHITSCRKLKELPELPANIEELYADFRFAFGSNIAKLAINCSKLYYSVSFPADDQFDRLKYNTFLVKKFIHFPFSRKNPFCVSYPRNKEFFKILRSFKYRSYESNGISINLNPPWYSQNFVGFAVCFHSLRGDTWGPHSDEDCVIGHCAVIAKLSHKDNGNEVLQIECAIAGSYLDKGHLCFAYIPFSSLWPEPKTKMDGVTPNDYSKFKVEFMNLKYSANWGCSLLYKRRNMLASWDGSLLGSTTDIGPLTKLEYLNLSGKNFEHLPECISRLRCLQYLDISGCERLGELPELPANIRELYANCCLASESNITELATKYSKLYSVSFSDGVVTLSAKELAKNFIPITEPFLNRNTPFAVTYTTTDNWADINISRCFEYPSYGSKKICIDLNPTWYSQNFVGFVVCFLFSGIERWESDPDIRPFRHCEVIAKLAHKDNGNEVLQTKCVIGGLYDEEFHYSHFFFSGQLLVCFAFIPFSSLWPESKTIIDDVTPNHYSVFEVAFLDLEVSTDWSCGLLYTDDELLIEAMRLK